MQSKINLTPIIDVVFLLIIFLVIVYQRIDAQNFQLDVPEDCINAANNNVDAVPPTVSVFINPDDGEKIFAVGAEKCPFTASSDIVSWLVNSINKEAAEKNIKTLRLRIDKNIKYRDAQLVLAAAAGSDVEDMEIAAIKEKN
ncbi:MAG: biopolymer transporter ExbD [Phycisphaerae bacterium]|nr:biopolymer transporter ExbD [Phycisphaerae bacterium]